ncbi:hypothetical protein JTE90_007739 [Oedothorax gibbosus]|uniref:Uncharacterized protein n=1 Tax=Oedothorax gibbosus TaxID=931172 RepID=A0AAV6V889_9ARAC|nr:hypothetical protein JTE90_007739 [Oedothorax gibbosus]
MPKHKRFPFILDEANRFIPKLLSLESETTERKLGKPWDDTFLLPEPFDVAQRHTKTNKLAILRTDV